MSHDTPRIPVFVVDDDPKLGGLLAEYLDGFGFCVSTFTNAHDALAALPQGRPALVVSDVMMPGLNGLGFLRKVREFSQVPFILLTARGEVPDRVLGLELGADDYVPKPFEPRELVARIQSVLRRGAAPLRPLQPGGRLVFPGLTIDPASQRVWVEGTEVVFTSTEFDVLHRLASRAGTVVSRDILMEEVRGIEWESYNRSIDVMISKIRSKIGCDSQTPRFIKTVRGSGYLFMAVPS
jgi:DNA-binding response OmpR family regulator